MIVEDGCVGVFGWYQCIDVEVFDDGFGWQRFESVFGVVGDQYDFFECWVEMFCEGCCEYVFFDVIEVDYWDDQGFDCCFLNCLVQVFVQFVGRNLEVLLVF